MKKIIVLSGAGMSADSGISTFRDSDGLWEQKRVEDICTPQALIRNRAEVITFYNNRRKELINSLPNVAHKALVSLEDKFDVQIITQNIDDLHERAGSTNILHLHGELMKLRSSNDVNAIIEVSDWEQKIDAVHSDGSLLRPFVVFFGEDVPKIETASEMLQTADIVIIIGTSLVVYPAASLVNFVRNSSVPIYLVDPAEVNVGGLRNPIEHIQARAAIGVPELVERLLKG